MPVSNALERGGSFQSLVHELARVVPYRSGHAGIGLVRNTSYPNHDRDRQIAAWCRRYLCLEHADAVITSDYVRDHVKSVGWITLLSADLAGQCGDPLELTTKEPPPVSVMPIGTGFVIQAGESPILGDTNREEELTAYIAANAFIQPVRCGAELVPTGFDPESAQTWIERFDQR